MKNDISSEAFAAILNLANLHAIRAKRTRPYIATECGESDILTPKGTAGENYIQKGRSANHFLRLTRTAKRWATQISAVNLREAKQSAIIADHWPRLQNRRENNRILINTIPLNPQNANSYVAGLFDGARATIRIGY